MESLEKKAKKLNDNLQQYFQTKSDTERVAFIMDSMRYLLDDAFKLAKNIRETSLPGADLQKRLIDAEIKFGIPKTHLL